MITLTDEQVLASAAQERLVNIVSAPGSGKTTVAAERFGFQRYRSGDPRGVLGLSFTRAAVAELTARITGRWGSSCLTFPHGVMTFDQLHVTLLEALLGSGLVQWPGGHTKLDVRDDYRGLEGFRWLRPPGNYRRRAVLDKQRRVGSDGVAVKIPRGGIGNRAQHLALLEAGITSHEDVREVLFAALGSEALRACVTSWIATNYKAIIIDEIYDAAPLDLEVAFQAAELGCAITLVGDPRQALYGWRGATPDQVVTLLNATTDSFVDYQQSHSFRFTGQQMPRLAAMLRSGCPVSIPNVLSADVDIALARRWRHLWLAGDNVLPLAFRNINNATDAAVNLLLDVVTRARFGRPSYGREAAITQLRLDGRRVAQEQDAVLRPILAELRDGGPPDEALNKLRGAVVCLGAARRPNRLKGQAEHNREDELGWLSVRLGQPALVPGLTVHQAKGGEWPRVGVVLTDHENQLLADGIRELEDDHCVLYVALTRAEHLCGRLAATATLEIDQDD